MFQKNRKEDVEQSSGQHADLFHAAVYIEYLRHASFVLHSAPCPILERLDEAQEFWRATNFGQDLEEASLLTKLNAFVRSISKAM